jgi:hypothetical protein
MTDERRIPPPASEVVVDVEDVTDEDLELDDDEISDEELEDDE